MVRFKAVHSRNGDCNDLPDRPVGRALSGVEGLKTHCGARCLRDADVDRTTLPDAQAHGLAVAPSPPRGSRTRRPARAGAGPWHARGGNTSARSGPRPGAAAAPASRHRPRPAPERVSAGMVPGPAAVAPRPGLGAGLAATPDGTESARETAVRWGWTTMRCAVPSADVGDVGPGPAGHGAAGLDRPNPQSIESGPAQPGDLPPVARAWPGAETTGTAQDVAGPSLVALVTGTTATREWAAQGRCYRRQHLEPRQVQLQSLVRHGPFAYPVDIPSCGCRPVKSLVSGPQITAEVLRQSYVMSIVGRALLELARQLQCLAVKL